jgi:hypothetical protein
MLLLSKHLNRILSFISREKECRIYQYIPYVVPALALVLAYKISTPLIFSNHFGKPEANAV